MKYKTIKDLCGFYGIKVPSKEQLNRKEPFSQEKIDEFYCALAELQTPKTKTECEYNRNLILFIVEYMGNNKNDVYGTELINTKIQNKMPQNAILYNRLRNSHQGEGPKPYYLLYNVMFDYYQKITNGSENILADIKNDKDAHLAVYKYFENKGVIKNIISGKSTLSEIMEKPEILRLFAEHTTNKAHSAVFNELAQQKGQEIIKEKAKELMLAKEKSEKAKNTEKKFVNLLSKAVTNLNSNTPFDGVIGLEKDLPIKILEDWNYPKIMGIHSAHVNSDFINTLKTNEDAKKCWKDIHGILAKLQKNITLKSEAESFANVIRSIFAIDDQAQFNEAWAKIPLQQETRTKILELGFNIDKKEQNPDNFDLKNKESIARYKEVYQVYVDYKFLFEKSFKFLDYENGLEGTRKGLHTELANSKNPLKRIAAATVVPENLGPVGKKIEQGMAAMLYKKKLAGRK